MREDGWWSRRREVSNIDHMLAQYLAGPRLLQQALAGMTHEQMTSRPVRGRWSTLEVVCHIVESEMVLAHRMKRVIAENKPLLISYDESRFAARLAYHEHKWEEELALLDQVRVQMARILRSLPINAWERTGIHNQQGMVTLEQLCRTAVDHLLHHMKFILEKRQALGLPLPELAVRMPSEPNGNRVRALNGGRN